MSDKDDGTERVPGRLMRTLKTAWLGGAVGTSYLGAKLKDKLLGTRPEDRPEGGELSRHLSNAKRIVQTMSELRGPMMKVGQLLSTHAEALPGEYGKVLKSLQSSAPPMAYRTIRTVLEQELGAPPESLFKDFTEHAVAAASLGQVHRATLPDGTKVAVKVQYPGADEAVRGDMRNLEVATGLVKKLLSDLLGKQRLDFTPIAEELAEHLVQETDYCREAYNAKLMGKLFEGSTYVVIPRVHDRFSGLRVLTYDWLEGEDLNSAFEPYDHARANRVVVQLSDLFWEQMARGGMLHADPHPGNYRVMPDGRLGVLDFGCVKIFDEAFMAQFMEMVGARFDGDGERLKRCMSALGLMDDPESAEELADMEQIANYFSVGLSKDEDFDFGSYKYVEGARELILYFLKRKRIPPAQKDFLFLSRVIVGYYEYFSRAKAKYNFRRMVEPHVRHGWQGRAITIPPYG